jgi:Tfp pilus assembly protein PilF
MAYAAASNPGGIAGGVAATGAGGGALYVRRTDIDRANACYAQAVELLMRDLTSSTQGDRRAAYNLLSDAIAVRPRVPSFYAARAQAAVRLAQPTEAISNLTTAIKLEPHNPAYLAARGSLLRQVGRPGDAIPDFEAAIRVVGNAPMVPQLRFLRGLVSGLPIFASLRMR